MDGRGTDLRAVLTAIFYLLRTGCQWRLLPREFPVWGTVYHYFRTWQNTGIWTSVHRVIYQQAAAFVAGISDDSRIFGNREPHGSQMCWPGSNVRNHDRYRSHSLDAQWPDIVKLLKHPLSIPIVEAGRLFAKIIKQVIR